MEKDIKSVSKEALIQIQIFKLLCIPLRSLGLNLLLNGFRNLKFARHTGLAKAAAGHLDPVFRLFGRAYEFVEIVGAFILVMTFGSYGPSRAARCASLASLIKIVKTIGIWMGIFPKRGFQRQISDHGPHAHGLAFGGYQAVAQAEGTQAAGVGGMPFRPVGGKADLWGTKAPEVRRGHGGYGLVTLFL